jgi:putative selenium-binding protein YdfZ
MPLSWTDACAFARTQEKENEMKIYDRNRNVLNQGQRVMIAATGAVDFLKEAHTDNMTPYQAEHEKCVLLANSGERYAPIELIRLG